MRPEVRRELLRQTMAFGRGDGTVGNPRRAQTSRPEFLIKLFVLSNVDVDKRFLYRAVRAACISI